MPSPLQSGHALPVVAEILKAALLSYPSLPPSLPPRDHILTLSLHGVSMVHCHWFPDITTGSRSSCWEVMLIFTDPSYTLACPLRFIALHKMHKITLATCCERRTHWKRPWCCERWKAEGEGGSRGWRWLDSINRLSGHEFLMKLQEIVEDRRDWSAVAHRVAKSQTRFSDWMTTLI